LSTFTTYFKIKKKKKKEKHCSEYFPTVLIRYTKQKNKEGRRRRIGKRKKDREKQ